MPHIPVISIIDDDASVHVATINLKRSLGYTVHTFASAEEFLRSARLDDTSCVIADVQMPAMSGVELQSLLAASGYRLPFIFITAFPQRDHPRPSAEGFLTKPFDGPTLIKCLGAALERHECGTSK